MNTAALKLPHVVHLDEVTHTYTVNGRVVPGVTSVLDDVLKEFAHIDRETLRRAQQRGTAVHKAVELYLSDTLDWATLDPALVPYIEAYIKFENETGFVVDHSEVAVYSERYNVAGKFDLLGRARNQRYRWMPDVKTPETLPISVGPQTAIYEQCARECGLIVTTEVVERKALQLFNDGTYNLEPLNDKSDLNTFLAALQIFNFKRKKRR